MAQGLDVLVRPMRSVALFHGLRDDQMASIARRTERIMYGPGDQIVTEDREGDAAILIVSGDAVRISGPAYSGEIEAIPVGSMIAEMAMLVEIVHASTIVARGQVRALRFIRDDMIDLIERDRTLADHFIGQVSSRLRGLANELRSADASVPLNTGVSDSTSVYVH